MAKLKSELEVVCPCCQTTLVIDLNLGRVVSHHEPERGNKPELSDAQRILAEEAARRESIFQQSVDRRARPRRRPRQALRGSAEAGQPGADHQADTGLRSRLRSWIGIRPSNSLSGSSVQRSRPR